VKGDNYGFVYYTAGGPPFNIEGNTFITNPGGYASSTTKTIEIVFSVPVSGLKFLAGDIDSGGTPYVERLTSIAYDSDNIELKTEIREAADPSGSGDGSVIPVDFGATSGISKVTISLSSKYTETLAGIGFGIDNLEFQILPVEISIDILPGTYPNIINLQSKGTTAVAILTTDGFDASTVDPTTVQFADASPVKRRIADANQDGRTDMILYFNTQELNLDINSTEATLTATTDSDIPISGTDSVAIVRKGKK
jgi:hypothetical protein